MIMRATFTIRRLGPSDQEPFAALRLRALKEEPRSFAASYEEEQATCQVKFAGSISGQSPSAICGAFVDEQLVGILGLHVEEHIKARHKGSVWGMYVAPEYRRGGIAKALLCEIITYAERIPQLRQVQLGVGEWNANARDLYRRQGFIEWGIEPNALVVDGEAINEIAMNLELRDREQ